jgi:hypothetical protein
MLLAAYLKKFGRTLGGYPKNSGLICRDQSSILKFRLAAVF